MAEPFTIWWYLQDHQEFKKIVQSMDVRTRLTNFITQISGKISTVSHTAKTDEKTLTKTKTDTLHQTSDVESLSKDGLKIAELNLQEKQSASEVEFEVLNRVKRGSPSPATYTSQKESEEIVRKKIGSIIKISWNLIVIFALAIGAYVFYREVVTPMQKKAGNQ